MIDAVEKRFPIDRKRIYATGHSNGGGMTRHLIRRTADVFAAFAPVGSMDGRSGPIRPLPQDGLIRPIWYIQTQSDRPNMYLRDDNLNGQTLMNCCRGNKMDYEKRSTYVSGIYTHTVFRDEEGRPILRFTGCKNLPHTYSPEMALMVWEDFFAHFLREEDGTTVYLG